MIQILTLARLVWMEMIRRKEFYVLLILMTVLLSGLLTINVFGLTGIAGYVKDMGLLGVWTLSWILAVNLSVRQLPQEAQRGTLFPLLAKPVSRLTLILGKWLGAWFGAGMSLLCLYSALVLGVWMKGGTFETTTLCQAVVLHGGALALLCAWGIALSTRLSRDAALVITYVTSGSAFLLLPRVPAMLVGTGGLESVSLYVAYYLLPHFEVFDLRRRLVHNWGRIEWLVVGEILLYALLMTVVFLTLAWLGYRKRRFSRGNTP